MTQQAYKWQKIHIDIFVKYIVYIAFDIFSLKKQ